jgi:hypothetical protein
VYAREVDGKELTFGVSGKLIEDSLVMYDRQTDSLWPQIDGTAISGSYQGKELRPIASSLLTWKEWKKLHPDTLVLYTGERARGSAYAGYFADRSIGIGNATVTDRRLHGKEKVIGVYVEGETLVFPLKKLKKQKLAQVRVAGAPLVAAYAKDSKTAVAFLAKTEDGRELTFGEVERQDDRLVMTDKETGTTWLVLSGQAIAGPHKGEYLEPARALVAFWYAWQTFNKESAIWGE